LGAVEGAEQGHGGVAAPAPADKSHGDKRGRPKYNDVKGMKEGSLLSFPSHRR